MTRHERRGAIVVLVFIALLLAATCIARCNREVVPTVPSADIRQFEAESDSSVVTLPAHDRKKPTVKKKRRRHATPKPSKPAPAPRRLDPVPQI